MPKPKRRQTSDAGRLEDLAACHDTVATSLQSFTVRWRQAFRRAKGQPELIKVLCGAASALEEARLALADAKEITTAWLGDIQAERCAAERQARNRRKR
jgi:hypothetical protein